MKRFSLLQKSLAGVLLLVVALLASCTSKSDLLKYASAEDGVVITGALSDVIENAGGAVSGSVVKLTPAMQNLLRTDLSRVDLGVDPSSCLVVGNFKANYMMLVMTVKSRATLEKYIERSPEMARTRTESDGYTMWRVDRGYFVLGDDEAFLTGPLDPRMPAPQNIPEFALEQAANFPLQSWQVSALQADNTLNILLSVQHINAGTGEDISDDNSLIFGYDIEKVSTGYVRLSGNLHDAQLKFIGQVYDKDGKELENDMFTQKVDAKMLQYAPEDAVAVWLQGMPKDVDWSETINNALKNKMLRQAGVALSPEQVEVVSSVLSNIDGTVMMSLQLGSIMQLASPNGWGVTIAAQMRPGAAAQYVSQIETLCQVESIPYTAIAGGMIVSLPDMPSVSIVAQDNMFLITSLPLSAARNDKKGAFITSSDFSGSTGAFVFRMPKGYPLLSFINMKSGVEVKTSSTPDQTEFTLSLLDSETPLLETLLKIMNY